MEQLNKLSELILKLQDIQNKYGDLDLYTEYDTLISKGYYEPNVSKLYYQHWEDSPHMINELSFSSITEVDEELYDVDLTRPIVKGLVL